jgi:hypothetical protein
MYLLGSRSGATIETPSFVEVTSLLISAAEG